MFNPDEKDSQRAPTSDLFPATVFAQIVIIFLSKTMILRCLQSNFSSGEQVPCDQPCIAGIIRPLSVPRYCIWSGLSRFFVKNYEFVPLETEV